MTPHTRQIKVCRYYSDYQPKQAPPYAGTPVVPWIRLKGKWLQQAGFDIDTPVTIEVKQGQLVLTAQ